MKSQKHEGKSNGFSFQQWNLTEYQLDHFLSPCFFPYKTKQFSQETNGCGLKKWVKEFTIYGSRESHPRTTSPKFPSNSHNPNISKSSESKMRGEKIIKRALRKDTIFVWHRQGNYGGTKVGDLDLHTPIVEFKELRFLLSSHWWFPSKARWKKHTRKFKV